MRRLLKDTLKGLSKDEDNRQGPQPYQAGPHPGGYPGTGVWPPPPGPSTGHLPQPTAVGYGGPTPMYGAGIPHSPGPQYQYHPGPAGYAGPYQHGQMAALSPPLTSSAPSPVGTGPRYWQQAMPTPHPAVASQPAMLPHQGIAPQQATTTVASPKDPIADKGSTPISHANSLALALRPAPHLKSATDFCRWCEKCKRGMAYGSLSFICSTCHYWLCPDCSEGHKRTHQQLVRASLWQWGATPQSFSESVVLCHVCAPVKEVLARIQCRDCPYALCMSCSKSPAALSKFLVYHNLRHKKSQEIELLVVYPEGYFITEKRKLQPCPCRERSTTAVTHCQRCHLLLEIGQQVHWCRGCFSDWQMNQWLCGTCFEEELKRDEEDKQKLIEAPENQQETAIKRHKHDFVATLLVETPDDPDTRIESIRCRTCEEWLATEIDRNTHFHEHVNANTDVTKRQPYLEWKLNPRMMEMFRIYRYKNCDKESTLQGSVHHTDPIPEKFPFRKCSLCAFGIAYNQPATFCLKSKCEFRMYCASCTEHRRVDHRHKDSTYVVTVMRQRQQQAGAQVGCAVCQKNYDPFSGIFCGSCRSYAICWSCITKTHQGEAPEFPPQLSHASSPGNSCPATAWLLFLDDRKLLRSS